MRVALGLHDDDSQGVSGQPQHQQHGQQEVVDIGDNVYGGL